MNTTQIIAECERLGIKLGVDRLRQKLVYKSKNPIPADLREHLKREGEAIIAIHNAAFPIDWGQRAAGVLAGIADADHRAGLRELFEERAAVLEHQHHLPRDEAERLAFEQVLSKAEVTR